MDPLNFCRLCLCRSECFIDIFGENVGLNFNVRKTIQDLLQFHVTQVEGVPSLACSTCIKELNHFRIFKSRCINSKVTFEKGLCLRQEEADICGRNYGEDAAAGVFNGEVTSEGLGPVKEEEIAESCGEGDGIEDSGGMPLLLEVDAHRDGVDDIPLHIVKVENDIEETPSHAQGIFQGELLASGRGFEKCTPCGDWNLVKAEESCRVQLGEGKVEDSEGVTGLDSAAMVVNTESLEQDSLPASEAFIKISLIRGSTNAAPPLDRYTKEEMKRALEEVHAGNPIRVVGRAYGIPESTIRRRLSMEKTSPHDLRRKRTRAFRSNHERKLAGFVRDLRDSKKDVGRRKLRSRARKYVSTRKIPCSFGSSPESDGGNWFDSFLERLATGAPEKLRPRAVASGMGLQEVSEYQEKEKEMVTAAESEKLLSDFILKLTASHSIPWNSYKIRQQAFDHAQVHGLQCKFDRIPSPNSKDWLDTFLEKYQRTLPQQFPSQRCGISNVRKIGYTESDMLQAVNAVMAGRPIRRVGREMGIAESTIRMRIKRMIAADG